MMRISMTWPRLELLAAVLAVASISTAQTAVSSNVSLATLASVQSGRETSVAQASDLVITRVTQSPSKRTPTCAPLKIVATAANRSGGSIEYAWTVLHAPSGAHYKVGPSGNNTATFVSDTEGLFDLQVIATNADGISTSLAFPVHVVGGTGHCLRRPATLDERFSEIARRVPQFGGAYVSGGHLEIVLTDTATNALRAAREAVDEIIGADRPLPMRDAVAVHGKYGFNELMAMRVRARSTLALAGVVQLGIDERKNRVMIGVVDDAAQRRVADQLIRLGVDRGTVVIETVKPMILFSNSSKIRPVIGGSQIKPIGTGGVCTLGFVADRNGKRGFITASHCSKIQGGVEGTTDGQAIGSDKIATEVADPMYFTGGPCPDGRRCRFSDTSFSRMDAGITNQRGEILDPTTFSNYRVAIAIPFPLEGETLRKVGRTTDGSVGEVSGTCDDMNQPSDVTLLCQDTVEATAAPGDSGAPVFMDWVPTPGVEHPVAAMGILWGGPADQSRFAFSDVTTMQFPTELGSLGLTFNDSAPSISIAQPTGVQKINYGGLSQTPLEATTTDTEDGAGCCTVTWKSNVDGPLGNGLSTVTSFNTPGKRTITATAKDSFGNESSDTVTVDTENTPPSIYIAKPAVGQKLWKLLPYTINGWAWDNESFSDLPCSSLTWTSKNFGDPLTAKGCTPPVTFHVIGLHKVTLAATDPDGASGQSSVQFSVADPSGGPIVSILAPVDGDGFSFQQAVTLVGTAMDTSNPGASLTYQWILDRQGTQTVLHTSTGPSGGQTTFQWPAKNDVPFHCGGAGVTIILKVTDPQGSATDSVKIFISYPAC